MKKTLVNIIMGATLTIANAQDNPLLRDWVGVYGGVPAFNLYQISDFKPAFDVAIQERIKGLDEIANNSVKPTFENTIVELEKVGKRLKNVSVVYGIYGSNISTPEFNKLQSEMEPILADLTSQYYQNVKLYERIASVYQSEEMKSLSAEQQRLVWLYYKNFVKQGAQLSVADKQKVKEINARLSVLFTQFSDNLLADENDRYVALLKESDFDGLPDGIVRAAKAEAKERNLNVLGCIGNTRSFVDPFLTFSPNRELRKKVFEMFVKRGDNNDTHDTKKILSEILKLRAEKAKVLGFPTFAHWNLTDRMAKNPEATLELMESVWKPAVNQVHKDVAEMQKIVKTEGGKFKIAPWDYRYYAEKVRIAKYDLNQNEIKEYLQLDKLREGMFWVAGELFGLEFKPAANIPVFNPDVKVWEVTKKGSGQKVGLWYFDPYARKGKRSGAWMNAYRNQYKIDGDVLTIVSNNSNFIKGIDGQPVLISWDDANTLFHEFGHALHGLCSNVTYPSLSGTAVARDYVEFPSQILERWLSTPEVLNKFALHYKTNQPIPQALVDKIEKAATFNEGFSTVETISSSIIDMKLHLAGDQIIDPEKFEKETLAELNMPSEIVMRHRIPQFGHIFSSDGYAAGYYSYLWADVISADATEAFLEAKGGFYDKAVAKRLYDHVFSVGNTVDQAEGYRAFRGKDPKSDALMKARGFKK
ncbi:MULTISPECIES: M3 family metallopeptidase [Flavobacterium]|uniref:M3 family metallopeptidase n=1 Tax=Flavobacterium hankyongi TaxID=1176532 RepID=A0ABP8ZLI6_9FLAO|nr:M3 family metallopeptidase [Flavobacterium sp. N1846]